MDKLETITLLAITTDTLLTFMVVAQVTLLEVHPIRFGKIISEINHHLVLQIS